LFYVVYVKFANIVFVNIVFLFQDIYIRYTYILKSVICMYILKLFAHVAQNIYL